MFINTEIEKGAGREGLGRGLRSDGRGTGMMRKEQVGEELVGKSWEGRNGEGLETGLEREGEG